MVAAALAAVGVFVVASQRGERHPSAAVADGSGRPRLLEVPEAEPVQNASPFASHPSPLPPTPDVDGVAHLAMARTPDRATAEQLAVSFAQDVTDARDARHLARTVEGAASRRMSTHDRRAIVQEHDVQVASGLQRHWDTTKATWLRSRVSGTDRHPERVDVEIAGVVINGDGSIVVWNQFRVDVVVEDGGLRVRSCGSSVIPPPGTEDERTGDLRSALTGRAWRRIPPTA